LVQLVENGVVPETKIEGGAFLVLAFGKLPMRQLLVRPSIAANVAPKEDATSFNPFVDVRLLARDPRVNLHGEGPTLQTGRTETCSNVLGDPEWEQPVIFECVEESPSLFLELIVCDSRFTGSDELASLVLLVKDCLPLQAAPLERKYSLKLMVPNRKHEDPWLFLSFGECSGPVPRDDTALRSSSLPVVKTRPVTANDPLGDLVVDRSTGRVVHGGVPALGVPDLGAYLETHGQTVPGILKSPFRPMVPKAVSMPPALVEALHHQTGTGQEQEVLSTAVAEGGGYVQGVVPMSFLSSSSSTLHLALPQQLQP